MENILSLLKLRYFVQRSVDRILDVCLYGKVLVFDPKLNQ